MSNQEAKDQREQYRSLVDIQDFLRRNFFFKKTLPVILLILACIYIYYYFETGDLNFKYLIIIGVIISFLAYPKKTGWLIGRENYELLIGSKDKQGNHRCIICGNKGIYRKGVYKRSTVYCSCSKCGFGLWVE